MAIHTAAALPHPSDRPGTERDGFRCTVMMMVIVVLVTSSALIVGAVWGLWGKMPESVEGFVVAVAGGALIVSVISELIEPASQAAPLVWVLAMVLIGACVFTLADWAVDRWSGSGGMGLLIAITLDGVPENLALGVALIGAGPLEVSALAGSILLSNLPEAAGGAKHMRHSIGHSRMKVFWLWTATAALLAASAIVGNLALAGVGPEPLALVRSFAAGAVAASLSTEVFPKAFTEDHRMSGIAAVLGLILAFSLHRLGG